jgi:hypothetical protein
MGCALSQKAAAARPLLRSDARRAAKDASRIIGGRSLAGENLDQGGAADGDLRGATSAVHAPALPWRVPVRSTLHTTVSPGETDYPRT